MAASDHERSPVLQGRLRLVALVLGLIVLGAGVTGFRLVAAVDVKHQELAYGAAQAMADGDALAVALQERSASVRGYLLSGDAAFLEARRAASTMFATRLRALRGRHTDTALTQGLASIAELERRLTHASDRAVDAAQRDRVEAIAIWHAQVRPVQASLAQEVAALVATQRAAFEAARKDARAASLDARHALLALAVVFALALGALLWELARAARQVIALVTKQQEQTMFRVLDEVPVGIVVTDAGGTPYYANQWSARLLGLPAHVAADPKAIARAFSAYEAGSDMPYPDERAPLARALRGESSEVSDMELRHGGDVVPVHVRGAPIYGAESRLAFAVAAYQDVRQLHDAAMRDPLTGLHNRRSLAQSFARERLLQERAGTGLALALLDLDHFKRINDTHGHAAGDLVLKRTAQNLQEALRRTDLLIRWGGEELVVVLPGVDLPGARAALDKALGAVRGESFVGAGHTTFRVTCSAGVVVARPQESLESVVARADALLYAAKRAGRDRIVTEGDEAAATH